MTQAVVHAHVVVKEPRGDLMFIRRVRHGRVYYITPGSVTREAETPGTAAARVAAELLGVAITIDEMLYAEVFAGIDHFFFLATAKELPTVDHVGSGQGHDDFELDTELEGTYEVVRLPIGTILAHDVRPRRLALRIAHQSPASRDYAIP